jgi:hypothetical protein
MLVDPEVMHDWPAPYSREQSDQKFDSYFAGYLKDGYGRVRLGTTDGALEVGGQVLLTRKTIRHGDLGNRYA